MAVHKMTSPGNIVQHEAAVKRWSALGLRCEECKMTIPFEHRRARRFCSQTCNVTANNRKRRTVFGDVTCYCGEVRRKTASRTRHCSQKCRNQSRTDRFIDWVQRLGGPPTHGSAKKFLLVTGGSECAMCGNSEWLGKPIALVLDHIDGNATNHSLGNIRLLCNNCDAQTPTFKGLNKGRGRRAYRRVT